MHRIAYQTGKADQWHHAYEYDGDNRIVNAYTTTATPYFKGTTGIRSAELEPTLTPYWDKEAEYSYYDHGPLARTVLGEQEVQGLDYAYTLQGWIKGVNSESLSPANDPGKDGYVSGSAPLAVAQDAYGYSLEYYTGDYATVNSGYGGFLATKTGSGLTSGSYSKNLYNGNIARMVTSITDPNSASNARTVMPLGSAYLYDQLNRLTGSRSFSNLASNAWGAGGTVKYLNTFTYDLNGNILSQNRQDDAGNTIDILLYGYQTYSGGPNNGKKIRNRLYHVDDVGGPTPLIDDDIEDMGTMANAGNVNTANNYSYDQEGRLIKDNQEQIYFIDWRVDGKVRSINSGKDGGHSLKFDYDAMGHRIAKHVYSSNFDSYISSVYYILDAQGNTMATYERIVDFAHSTITFAQTEKHIYGSKRLGVMTANIPMLGSQNNSYSQAVWTHTIGQRVYELQNHLGNVLSTVTDKPIPVGSSATVGTLLSYFVSDIQQSTAYSAFGVQLNAHNLKKTSLSKDYRYGYQGSEKDDEIKGRGNSYTTEYRFLDPRLGRWLTTDPKASLEAGWTPYRYGFNSPISINDPNGDYELKAKLSKSEKNALKAKAKESAVGDKKEFKKIYDKLVDEKIAEIKTRAEKNITSAYESLKSDPERLSLFEQMTGLKSGTKEFDNYFTNNGKGVKLVFQALDVSGGTKRSKILITTTCEDDIWMQRTLLHEYIHYTGMHNNIKGDDTKKGYNNLTYKGSVVTTEEQQKAIGTAYSTASLTMQQAMLNSHYAKLLKVTSTSRDGHRVYCEGVGVEGGYLFEIIAFGEIIHRK